MAKYLDEEWLRHEVEVKGRKYLEIAKDFGVHYNTIANRARSYGITHESLIKSIENKDARARLRDKEWLYEEYITKDKSYTEIIEEFKVSRSSLSRWIIRHGIEKPMKDKMARECSKISRTCKQCDEGFKVVPSIVENGNGKFCSRACSATYHYHNGTREALHKGRDEFMESDRGKTFMIERGKRISRMLAKGYKTSIEIALEKELTRRGIPFTEQKEYKLGIADIFIEPNIYVFADGDYWHAYDAVIGIAEPTEKQAVQIAKDIRQTRYLEGRGNVELRFWEHEINADVEACIDIVLAEINEIEAIA